MQGPCLPRFGQGGLSIKSPIWRPGEELLKGTQGGAEALLGLRRLSCEGLEVL